MLCLCGGAELVNFSAFADYIAYAAWATSPIKQAMDAITSLTNRSTGSGLGSPMECHMHRWPRLPYLTHLAAAVALSACGALAGCAARTVRNVVLERPGGLIAPENRQPLPADNFDLAATASEQLEQPLSLQLPEKTPWPISVAEAVQIAVERSKVLQDLGGSTLRNTSGIATIHDPAIQATDPRLGVEAALSAFDAQLASRTFVSKNDFPINNRLLGGGTNLVQQDLITFQNELTKATAFGTELFARRNTTYDANNAPNNLFRSSWQTNIEAGLRHHLGRGGGLDYNRIAGPGALPGTYSGVLIARVNSDASVLDFEMGLRDLVSDVENAYWDLYFAYRDLESKIAARDAALNTWRIEQLYREQQSGSGEKEARAREQYFRFEAQVLQSLSGREVDGTRTNNGSSGGTFRGNEGVHTAERRLRLLMNLPINDGRMLRPSHDPVLVNVIYDWNQLVSEAMELRPELRKQDLQIRRSQLEAIASKNALLPQFDLLAQYRLRGFGDDLWGSSTQPLDNAMASLVSGQFQEWQFGLEMSLPVGLRRAYNNVRHAQIRLARDQDLLKQKQRRVVHDLSNAYAASIRGFQLANVTLNQRMAAHEQLAILRNLEENQSRVNINEILDAQSRASQADSSFYEALVSYMLALKNVHYEKGTILEYNNINFVDRVHRRPVQVAAATAQNPVADYRVPDAQLREMASPPPPSPLEPSAEELRELPASPPLPVPPPTELTPTELTPTELQPTELQPTELPPTELPPPGLHSPGLSSPGLPPIELLVPALEPRLE